MGESVSRPLAVYEDTKRQHSSRRNLSTFLATVATISLSFTGVALATTPGDSPQSGPEATVGTEDDASDISAIPTQLDVAGTLFVFPDEPHSPGGVFISTEDGNYFELSGIEAGEVATGDQFDGTVAVSSEVAQVAIDGVTVESTTAEVAAEIADAAAKIDEAMTVVESSITTAALETDSATSPHQIDVVWLGKSGTKTPTLDQLKNAITRSGQYWGAESSSRMPGFTIRNARVVTNTGLADKDLCISSFNQKGTEHAAKLFNTTPIWYANSARTHLVILVPSEKCGGYGVSGGHGNGLGTIGKGLNNGGIVWASLDGDRPAEWNHTLTHEFGHNFSLGHSNVLWCKDRVDAPKEWVPAWGCYSRVYADYYDPMSGGLEMTPPYLSNGSNLTTLNVYHKVRLGLLQAGSTLQNINVSGGDSQTVNLQSATATSGVRGFRIKDPQTGGYLYVEYRSGTGRDANSFYAKLPTITPSGYTPAAAPGIHVLRSEGGTYGDTRNSTALRRNASNPNPFSLDVLWYGPGHTFTGHAKVSGRPAVKIQVVSANGTQARVKIDLDSGKKRFTAVKAPTITGDNYTGQVLTANAPLDNWTPKATKVTYQWYRNGVPIQGATKKTFALRLADKGQQITVQALGTLKDHDPRASFSAAIVPAGPTVTRQSGASRYDTAVEISKSTYPNAAAVSTVYLATGTNYPDALGAAAAAAKDKAPLILLPKKGPVSTAVIGELGRLNPSKVVIAGGTGAVPDAVVDQAVSGIAVRPEIQRRAGATRYETGRLLVSGTFTAPASAVFVATGRNFPDALSASAAAGALKSPVILVDGKKKTVDSEILELINKLAPTSVYIVGGAGAVSTGIEAQLKAKYTVSRLSGSDRYTTSQAINNQFFKMAAATPAVSTHYWATGTGFADALAGAAAAGSKGMPLYTVKKTCVPVPVLDHLAKKRSTSVVLLGGTGVLNDHVATLKRC